MVFNNIRERLTVVASVKIIYKLSREIVTWLAIRNWQDNRLVTLLIQSDSFGTRPKKMRISQRLFIRF